MENNSPSQPPQPPPMHPSTTPNGDQGVKDERMWAMFCHLAGLAGFVVTIPFAGVVGPLIIWILKKDEYPLVLEQGKEALNFQISVALYFIILIFLIFFIVGLPLLFALLIFHPICVIIAAVKASEGVSYRYPLCIRFIK